MWRTLKPAFNENASWQGAGSLKDIISAQTETMCGKGEGVLWWMKSLEKSQGQNPRVCRPQGCWAENLPKGLNSIWYTKGFSTCFHSFVIPTSKEEFLFPMVSLGTPLENEEGMKPLPSVELNPYMLGRDIERMMNSDCVSMWLCD